MTDQALPSLFGRFTAVLREHDHLGATLRELRQMCTALDRRDGEAERFEPRQLFGQLRDELTKHFSAEEADGYFGTVVEEAPTLGPQVEALRGEHAVMLQAVGVLCELAVDASDSPRMTDLARRLFARLEQHERAESALLRGLFHPDAG
jgi:hypothetical protein